jgi:ABC-type sugar transport system permease subunit
MATKQKNDNTNNVDSNNAVLCKKNSKNGPFNKRGQTIFIIVMLALPVIQWLIFWLYVNLQSIMLAFKDMRTGEFTFINFITFWKELTKPKGDIGIAIKNTMLYFLTSMVVVIPISTFISYFIYKRILFYKGFRIIFYLPAIIPAVVMVEVFRNFIDPTGPLGAIVGLFGGKISPEGLLARTKTATSTILFYYVWAGFTTTVLLFSGAMTRIPLEILESAKIEGVGPFKELILIILPLIWPTISTQIILALTGLFNASGPILLFTKGAFETTTLSYWIFSQVYGDGTLGGTGTYNLVSCTGLCFTVVGVPIILSIRALINKIDKLEF